LTASAQAQGKQKKPREEDYYKLLRFEVPAGQVLEAGALEVLPDGKVAVGTRRGEIWLIDNAYADDPKKAGFSRFAHGLHEVLGLAQKDGWLYVTQRPELTRIKDTRGTGKANRFETVSDGWEINGDYHEYAFGSRFDRDGNIWITLCLTGSFNSSDKFRGWAVKVTPEGKMIPTTSGVRSPGGVGFNAEGDVFYTDNQGPWNGACALKQLVVGGFVGHPDSFRWYKEKEAQYLGPAPKVPKSGSRIMIEAKKIPQLIPPSVIFPYGPMGQSASGFDCDLTGGKFGPFA
jgi:glucose/arabinose dehydrogenase